MVRSVICMETPVDWMNYSRPAATRVVHVEPVAADQEPRGQRPPAPANLRDWKHSLQKTGRPCVGRNGTVVSLPHAEQVVTVSTRSRPTGPPAGRLARFPLQALHRFG